MKISTKNFTVVIFTSFMFLGSSALFATLSSAKKVLGYDPETSAIPAEFNENDCALICSHGFGASKKDFGFKSNRKLTVLSFHYVDSRQNGETLWWRKATLGQEEDALALLYHIALCAERGCRSIIVLAESRGCAALIRTWHIIKYPERYVEIWGKLGYVHDNGALNVKKITAVKNAMQQKKHFLARPLLSARHAIAMITERNVPKPFQTPAQWFIKTAIALFTRHNSSKPEPIELLTEMIRDGFMYQLEVFLVKPDGVVSNALDRDLEKLAEEVDISTITIHQANTTEIVQHYKEKYRVSSLPKPETIWAHCYIPDAIAACRNYLKKCGLTPEKEN